MKKVLIIMLLMSLILTGCHKAVPTEFGEAESSTVWSKPVALLLK